MASVCLPAGDIFVPVEIDPDNVTPGILNFLGVIQPNWNPDAIKFKTFTDGITNKLIACIYQETQDVDDEVILVRIYGNKTDLLIDRKAELRNIKCLHSEGLAPKVYGVFKNGLAYEYYPGTTLDVDSVLDLKIWALVGQTMAKMHKVNLPLEVTKEPMVWDKIEQFLSLLPEPFTDKCKQERFIKSFGSITKLRIEFERLKSLLSKTESPIVFAHNDLLLGNVIHNQDKGTVSFIDYEYAAYNYQAYDIGNHFNEFVGLSNDINYSKYPCKSFQKEWLENYLREYLNTTDIPHEAVEKLLTEVEHMALASHFLWGVWSLVQYELSDIDFDFGRYAEIRLTQYFKTKDNVFKMLL